MAITIAEIEAGIRLNSIHGLAMDREDVPAWIGQVMSELALVTAGEEIVYAHALWLGNAEKSDAVFAAFTDSLLIVSVVPNSRDAGHRTSVVARRSLRKFEVAAKGQFDSGRGPGRVSVLLQYEGVDGPIELPGRGPATYISARDIAPFVETFARDIRA